MTDSISHATYAHLVTPETVHWLWPGRLACGKLALLDGDPGLGKSTLAVEIAACISTGRALPGGETIGPAGVVLASLEDSVADTIVPRLRAAGADLEKVLVWETVPDGDGGERPPAVPDDLPYLEDLIREADAKLVVLDPLMAFLAGSVNAHRDQDIRRALAPLARLAADTDAAVLVLRHLTKAVGSPALYGGGGSIGIIGAARIGLLLTRDDDPNQRLLSATKCNLARLPPTLKLQLVQADERAAHIEWLGESSLTAEEALAVAEEAPERPTESGRLTEACDWLTGELANGAVGAAEVQQRAREAGLTDATLRRAKESLGVQSARGGFGRGGAWVWRLPIGEPHSCATRTIDAQPLRDEHVEQVSDPLHTYAGSSCPSDGDATEVLQVWAQRILSLSPEERAHYRAELRAAPPDDPQLAQEWAAFQLAERMQVRNGLT